MAFLMLLHEKMKLQRKYNKLTLKQLRNGNLLSRMENKIKKREKYYSKLEKQLETQANAMKNNMKMQISNMMGLGMNSVNLNNPYGSSAAALQIFTSWKGKNPLDNGATDIKNPEFVKAVMMGAVGMDGDKYYMYGSDGKLDKTKEYDKTAYENAQRIISCANSQVSMMQGQCQAMQANYENQVSIWLDYQKEQLDAQQEWEMDLLAEEQNDYEMEKTCIESELEMVKERKQAIEQQLGEAIKDSAPKFGLA